MRIVVLDDEPFFRHLLVRALDGEAEIEVVGDYDTAAELVDELGETRPDAAVLDLVLAPGQALDGPGGGFQAGLDIRDRLPDCGIVLLSNHVGASVLAQLPEGDGGGWAYLLKRRTDDIHALVHALETTVAGETMIDPAIVDELEAPTEITSRLSPQDARVLMLLISGASNRAIADQLGVTPKSVEHSISGILRALEIDAGDGAINARVTAAVAGVRLLGQVR